MKHITHRLTIMLFMLMMACGASAQKGFFGSISRSKGVEYFYSASINRSNPNLKKGVPKIKGIDVEYLVNHISGIEMVSATSQDNGTDMTDELQKSVVSTIQEKEFETIYQINDDDQELILYFKPDKYEGGNIVITQQLKKEPSRFMAVKYGCFKFDLDKLFTD
jgi:formyltetrahydrofolate synthetase